MGVHINCFSVINRFMLRSLVFLALFLYFYPVQLNFLPFLPMRIFQIAGLIMLLIDVSKYKRLDRNIIQYCVFGFLIFFVGYISSLIINGTLDLEPAYRGLYIVFYIFTSYFVVKLLNRLNCNLDIYHLVECIVIISLVQAIISFSFYISPDLYAEYNNLVIEDDIKRGDFQNTIGFRLMGIGDIQYATASVQYGIALWSLILLKKQKKQSILVKPLIYNVIICVLCAAGILSARTFIIIIVVTIAYIFYLYGWKEKQQALKSFFTILITLSLLLLIGVSLLLLYRPETIEWAFELFINFKKSGVLTSNSTSDLQTMYFLPENVKTLLFGDGKFSGLNGGFYMNTDVGYIRSIFYWGLIGSIIYYAVPLFFYHLLKKCIQDISIRKYLKVILIWFYIYSFKDFWYLSQYYTLFLVFAVYANKYKNPNLSMEVIKVSVS